jgi:hypothetical protein
VVDVASSDNIADWAGRLYLYSIGIAATRSAAARDF